MFIIFIPVYCVPVSADAAGADRRTDGFIQSTSALHWGLMTTVFSISHAAYLLVHGTGCGAALAAALVGRRGRRVGRAGLLFFLVLLTELNDIFQYLWGKSFGHVAHRTARQPGKDAGRLPRRRRHDDRARRRDRTVADVHGSHARDARRA